LEKPYRNIPGQMKNIEKAMNALETALSILDSDDLRDELRNLPETSLIYLNGVNSAVRVAIENLKK
jgi:hypothetical protein